MGLTAAGELLLVFAPRLDPQVRLEKHLGQRTCDLWVPT